MRPLEALAEAMLSSGMNKTKLAKRMGRNESFIHGYYSRGSIPKVDTYYEMVNACDCDLIIRNRNTGLEIPITSENEDSIETYLE